MIDSALRINRTATWDFKTLSEGKLPHQIIDLSDEQQIRIPKYNEALITAAASTVSSPKFSQYFVKESIGSGSHSAIPAGNIEYGLCQAIHGEESAVAAHRSRLSSLALPNIDTKDLVLGIIAGNPGNIPAPCGNCRDVMIDGLGTDFEIVSGSPEGGLAVVVPMEMFTFDPQDQIDIHSKSRLQVVNNLGMSKGDFQEIVSKTLKQGKLLTNDPYSPPNVNPERKYFATIVTKNNLFHGARDVMVDYHPIYALRDAIRQARRNNDSLIQSVVIVAEDPNVDMPRVMYKDRQHLLEYNLQGELINGSEKDPPVFLVGHDKRGKVTNVWKTSVKEWLPFPFNPRNFGDDFVKYLGVYHRNR